jgi:hypothetical protein
MAFGRKKNKEASETPTELDQTQDAPAGATRAAGKKRKPGELLSSVVNESAVGAAIDIMKRNEAFALPNGTAWVGLLLNTDSIGGLNLKQKGDATKGSIIELIAADKIQVVATKEMLDQEFLGIIPTSETLERMDEYSLLTQAPYFWAVFRSEDGNTLIADAVQDVRATYADAVAVSRGKSTLSAVLPEVWAWGGGINEPALTAQVPAEAERVLVGASIGASGGSTTDVDVDPLADAFGFEDDGGVDYASLAEGDLDLGTGEIADEPPLEFDTEQFESQFAEEQSGLSDEDEDAFDASWQDDDTPATTAAPAGDEADGYFQYLAENRDRVVDEQEVRDTIARRFLSTDLDLVVDVAEFDQVFSTAADAITLDVSEDASDWLGSQVAQISRQANAELALLHQGNTDELRQLFIETMALHVEKTMAAVSTDAAGSQYAALMDGAKRDFEAQRASAPQEIAEQRREITARFDAAANSRAEQAAAHARAVYEDKNRPKLERELAEVGLDVDRRHEEHYAHDRQTVLEMRKKEANVRMDVGTNRIFELLRTRQAEQRAEERALLERWNGQIIQFIDENRKNDVARAIALAEELNRSNKVEDLKQEHKAELRELRRDHADREEQLNQELIRIREEARAELESRQASWTSSLEIERERSTTGNALVTQLQTQVDSLAAQYETKYQGQIENLKADKKAAVQELKRSHDMQRRATWILVILGVVITVAAVAVGVILGWSWGHNQAVQSVPAASAALRSLLT